MPLFKTRHIDDPKKRKIAFCKKKKDLLKRAIDLSKQCSQSILLVIHDPADHRMTFYSSSHDFNLTQALQAKMHAKNPTNVHLYERFTNDDYETLCSADFRKLRYRREQVFKESQRSEAEEMAEIVTKKRRTSGDAFPGRQGDQAFTAPHQPFFKSHESQSAPKERRSSANWPQLEGDGSKSQSPSFESTKERQGLYIEPVLRSSKELAPIVIQASNHLTQQKVPPILTKQVRLRKAESLSSIRTDSPESQLHARRSVPRLDREHATNTAYSPSCFRPLISVPERKESGLPRHSNQMPVFPMQFQQQFLQQSTTNQISLSNTAAEGVERVETKSPRRSGIIQINLHEPPATNPSIVLSTERASKAVNKMGQSEKF